MAGAPIKLTLYDPKTGEEKDTFTQLFIPWKLLKQAARLQKIDQDNLTDDDIDAITALVVETFGNRFTLNELNDGADLSEMIAVVMAIVNRAKGGITNPTPPGK